MFISELPDICLTPNKTAGHCIEIKKCPTLLNLLLDESAKEFLRSSKCDSDGKDFTNPIVCCEIERTLSSKDSMRDLAYEKPQRAEKAVPRHPGK